MLFNSYVFVLYFCAVFFVSRVVRSWTARKLVLLAASYLFYAAWNPPFVALLWASTVVDWLAAKGIDSSPTARGKRLYLGLSLAVNLGMLGYFKYCGFLLSSLNDLLQSLDVPYAFGAPNIFLPVGISFYTFQTLSYTIDIYRGNSRPWHSFLDYALYVSFFPQLVAGPIVRASEFLPQCNRPRKGRRDQIGWGLHLFVIGLFMKVVMADALTAPIVEKVYDSGLDASFLVAWTGTLAFSIQIFSDFFGYSICAIGIALCLGFELPDNFRFPYAALGFSDFWRRWHISLSSWLRDYLYIPLGGNRRGRARTYVNLGVTMLLGGLWHGASWMFVIWGGLHGVFLVAERLVTKTRLSLLHVWKTVGGRIALCLLTFGLVDLAWVFFRAGSLDKAFALSASMLDLRQAGAALAALLDPSAPYHDPGGVKLRLSQIVFVFAATALVVAGHGLLRNSSIEERFAQLPAFVRALAVSFMIWAIVISMTGGSREFIYFQF